MTDKPISTTEPLYGPSLLDQLAASERENAMLREQLDFPPVTDSDGALMIVTVGEYKRLLARIAQLEADSGVVELECKSAWSEAAEMAALIAIKNRIRVRGLCPWCNAIVPMDVNHPKYVKHEQDCLRRQALAAQPDALKPR